MALLQHIVFKAFVPCDYFLHISRTFPNLLSVVNRFLPGAEGAPATSTSGMEVQQRLRSPLLHVLTGLGRAAVHRLHQYTHTGTAPALSPPTQRHHP